MASFEYLVDGHQVDDAGNLIACTYVDFQDPAPLADVSAAAPVEWRYGIPFNGVDDGLTRRE